MKTLSSIVFLICLSIFGVAQPDKYATALMNAPFIAFEEQQINFRESVQPSLSILITSEESGYVKNWKNWLKTKYLIEAKKNAGFYSAVGILISEWSMDTINFHYKTDKDGDAVRLNILIERKGEFFSEKNHPEELAKVKAAVEIQVKEFYIKYYDEKIADQQKFYNLQVGDLEKLMKKKDKINGSIQDHNNTIAKTEDAMRGTNNEILESEGKIKSLDAQLQQDQKAEAQAKKEVDAQQKLIADKEVEYNKMNAAGSLYTKEGEKLIKELEKFNGKQEKLLATLTKAQEGTTKTENAILKEGQVKTKLTAKLGELKNSKDKNNSDVSALKSDLEKNEGDAKDEQKQIDAALVDLEKLKSAKGKLTEVKP